MLSEELFPELSEVCEDSSAEAWLDSSFEDVSGVLSALFSLTLLSSVLLSASEDTVTEL